MKKLQSPDTAWQRALPFLEECFSNNPEMKSIMRRDKYSELQRIQLWREGGYNVKFSEKRTFRLGMNVVTVSYTRDHKRHQFTIDARVRFGSHRRWVGGIDVMTGYDKPGGIVCADIRNGSIVAMATKLNLKEKKK